MNQVLARDDDVINVAGHRLSTSAIEEVKLSLKYQRSNSHPNIVQVVLRHPLVIDCAVVGVSDKLKGQMPLGLVVTKGEVGLEILGGEEHYQRSSRFPRLW